MKKYLAILNTQIQNSFQYRGQLFFWVIVEVLFLAILFFLWQAIFSEKEQIGAYTFSRIMTYYLAAFAVEMIASSHNEYNMEEIIRDGKLNKYLIRPMSFFWYRLASDLGWKISKLVVTLPVFIAVLAFFHRYLLLPDLVEAGKFAIVLLTASALYFLISYLISFAAFWILRINSVIRIVRDITLPLMAGSLISLDLYPRLLEKLTRFLPFRYLIFFPVQVFLGKVSNAELLSGILVTLIWIIVLGAVAFALWPTALKRYESVGG